MITVAINQNHPNKPQIQPIEVVKKGNSIKLPHYDHEDDCTDTGSRTHKSQSSSSNYNRSRWVVQGTILRVRAPTATWTLHFGKHEKIKPNCETGPHSLQTHQIAIPKTRNSIEIEMKLKCRVVLDRESSHLPALFPVPEQSTRATDRTVTLLWSDRTAPLYGHTESLGFFTKQS